MKKHIVMILTNGFDPDVRVYKEAVYLTSKNYDVTILCWAREKFVTYPDREIIDGVEILRFQIKTDIGTGIKQLPKFLVFVQKCREYFQKNKVDIVHCHDLDGAVVGYLINSFRIPSVFDMHEFYERGSWIKRWFIRKMVIFLQQKSCAGICVGRRYFELNEYKDIRNNLYELSNYPDLSLFPSVSKNESEKFRIGYHGAVRGQLKFFKNLFEAVKDMDDVRIDINGGGPDLKKLTQLQSAYKNVFIHGVYDGVKDSMRLYQATDLLYCAYNHKNLNYGTRFRPVKFYEAIVTGTPMLITEELEIADVASKEGFGLRCDTSSVESIKREITEIKNDRYLWQKMRENELRQRDEYSWQNAVKILDIVYEKAGV